MVGFFSPVGFELSLFINFFFLTGQLSRKRANLDLIQVNKSGFLAADRKSVKTLTCIKISNHHLCENAA